MLEPGSGQIGFWFVALMIGVAAGFAALFFRKGIDCLQSGFYGPEDAAHLRSHAGAMPWHWVLLIPVAGGLAVGVILHFVTDDGRARSVAEVIEGAACILRRGRRPICGNVPRCQPDETNGR